MRRGDVWWAKTPAGRRPVVVLTRDSAIALLTRVTVAPTTTHVRNIPTEVRLTRADGMPAECVATLDNVQGLQKRDLVRRITSLETARLDQICDALAYALGC